MSASVCDRHDEYMNAEETGMQMAGAEELRPTPLPHYEQQLANWKALIERFQIDRGHCVRL